MESPELEFIVANDPSLDYDLIKEVYKKEDNQQIADLRCVEGTWCVTFFSKESICQEITWTNFEDIYVQFKKFVEESKNAT